jgi:uncharacterized protein YlxP (DUF503 family)
LTIGVYSFEIHLHDSRSLKDKRKVLRRLKDRLRSRHNVAVAEVDDHADLWQRAGLVVVSVATNRDVLARLFENVQREAEAQVPGQVIDTGTEFIEASDAGAVGWNGEIA